MHAGAYDALHGKRRACCNHPVANVSADEMTAVDATDYCGARVAVPGAAAVTCTAAGGSCIEQGTRTSRVSLRIALDSALQTCSGPCVLSTRSAAARPSNDAASCCIAADLCDRATPPAAW